jgi:hypothetical protein
LICKFCRSNQKIAARGRGLQCSFCAAAINNHAWLLWIRFCPSLGGAGRNLPCFSETRVGKGKIVPGPDICCNAAIICFSHHSMTSSEMAGTSSGTARPSSWRFCQLEFGWSDHWPVSRIGTFENTRPGQFKMRRYLVIRRASKLMCPSLDGQSHRQNSVKSAFLKFIATAAMLVACIIAAQAQPPRGANRPATVPPQVLCMTASTGCCTRATVIPSSIRPISPAPRRREGGQPSAAGWSRATLRPPGRIAAPSRCRSRSLPRRVLPACEPHDLLMRGR